MRVGGIVSLPAQQAREIKSSKASWATNMNALITVISLVNEEFLVGVIVTVVRDARAALSTLRRRRSSRRRRRNRKLVANSGALCRRQEVTQMRRQLHLVPINSRDGEVD